MAAVSADHSYNHHHVGGIRGKKRSRGGATSREWRSTYTLVLVLTLMLLASFLTSCLIFLGMEEHEPRLRLLKAFHHSIHDLVTKKSGGGGLSSCDYSMGVWVRTRRKPLYSGQECERWLSPMWACRLHPNRSSFPYESLRWQPHTCSLPLFHPPTFLRRMHNRTIAFIGDSLGRQQFQSLMCLLTQGKDDYGNVLDVGLEFGFQPYVKASKLNNTKTIRPSSWAYRFEKTRTTILFSWSPTLCHIESLSTNGAPNCMSNVSKIENASYIQETAFHADRPPMFLASNLDKLDVIVLSTGPHWSLNKFIKNGWKPHIGHKPLDINMTKEAVDRLHSITISKLMDWLEVQVNMGVTRATIFYRTLSPHHFFGGNWNSGGRCDNIHYRFMNSIAIRNSSKPPLDDIEDLLRRRNVTTIKLLNITWISQLRDEAHIAKYTFKAKNGTQDCLHWCLPGVPDTWNEILYAHLLETSLN